MVSTSHSDRKENPVLAEFHEEAILKPRNIVRLQLVRGGREIFRTIGFNARTDAGASFLASLAGSGAGVPLAYIGLSTATLTPVKTDTTLASEIVTTGLARKTSTYGSYTAPTTLNGAASYVLSASFTNGGGSAVTVVSAGCFSAVSGGTLGFETNFSASTTLQVGDTANVSWTFNV
jgi:hypothetical protein